MEASSGTTALDNANASLNNTSIGKKEETNGDGTETNGKPESKAKRKLEPGNNGELSKKPRKEEPKLGPTTFPLPVDSLVSATATDAEDPKPKKLGESPAALKNTCTHLVSLPSTYPKENYDFNSSSSIGTLGGEAISNKAAKKYKFELDAFQRQSVKCLERRENLLVAAHTSAGKTAVAEYAIAMAFRDKQRVIYTSPIKALSNQKYRELSCEFSDVGILTGDVSISVNASCLVMTTEILRSMLYKGSQIVREVAWVIFDEVHYMRDKERGVVWEESIILLPPNVRFVFLSATIPNARDFSEWICHLRNEPCHTIFTDTRPVPLQHYLHPCGGEGLHLVLDDNNVFRPEAFEKAIAAVKPEGGNAGSGGGAKNKGRRGKKKPGGKTDMFKVVQMIKERGMYPCIVFSFARRDCESMALQMAKLDFNDEEEAKLVEKVYSNALSTMDLEDQNLPQVGGLLTILKRGIGIHHSGLLPVAKELVELLFGEGLVKVLFATETFAMGLNMPAKTVVFSAFTKFDGKQYRAIQSGEYVQMSGRAGRRGQDEKGVAILMIDQMVEAKSVKDVLTGSAEPLSSSFHLGYNMLLNLLRAEEADPEYIIARSLAQFQADRRIPETQKKLKLLSSEFNELKLIPGNIDDLTDEDVERYFKMKDMKEDRTTKMREHLQRSKVMLPFLQMGRVVHVFNRTLNHDYEWGVVITWKMKNLKTGGGNQEAGIDVLCRCRTDGPSKERPLPFKQPEVVALDDDDVAPNDPSEKYEWLVITCERSEIECVSALRINVQGDVKHSKEVRQALGSNLREIVRRFRKEGGMPVLDPIKDMSVTDRQFGVTWKETIILDEEIKKSLVPKHREYVNVRRRYRKKEKLREHMRRTTEELRVQQGLILKDKLTKMKRVLRRLNFLTDQGIVETKGRVACEVNTADELVLTEFLFEGNMNEMPTDVLVAVLSCFVVDEPKKDEELQLEKDLEDALEILRVSARKVAEVLSDCEILEGSVDEYIEKFNPIAMRIIRSWCEGNSFSHVCGLSEMFEGSVVRCLRRLDELLRQLICAAKSIGNSELEEKLISGKDKVRKGIAFHPSLYT